MRVMEEGQRKKQQLGGRSFEKKEVRFGSFEEVKTKRKVVEDGIERDQDQSQSCLRIYPGSHSTV